MDQTKKLLKQFEGTLKDIKPLLLEKYGDKDAEKFCREAYQEFAENILPQIPDIGGAKNPYNRFLNLTAMALAIYRVVQKRNGTVEEAGEIAYKGTILLAEKMPKTMMKLYGRWTNSRISYPRLRKEAQQSQMRRYPQDWVYEFVDGNGQDFDYGIDMHECGIMKFLEDNDALALTPYLCAVDYITFDVMGIELRRTQSLAYGCKKCDFRFIVKGNPMKPTWPPAFPEKRCGKQKP